MFSVIACIRDDHDWRLIVAAAIVCLAGSVATMLLLLRAERSEGGQRSLWVAASGLACGFGVWSTHFIAMLAYDGGVPVAYGLWGTALSMVVAIAASWIAFTICLSGGSRLSMCCGGFVLGAGVAAMHFTGMQAIEIHGHISYDPQATVSALVVGTLLAGAALHAFHALRSIRRLVSASPDRIAR